MNDAELLSLPSPVLALREVVARCPTARIGGAKTWYSYSEFDRWTNRFAQYLSIRGVEPGDRVVIVAVNSVEMLVALVGTMKAGAVAVPLNNSLVGDWLRYQLTLTKPSFLVVDAALAATVADATQEGDLPTCGLTIGGAVSVKGITLEPFEVVDTAPDTAPEFEISGSDLGLIIFTSGTTGRSKGCKIGHGYIANIARLLAASNRRTSEHIVYVTGPMSHAAALANVMQAVMTGGGLYIGARFSAESFWDEVEFSGATATSLMGLMVPMLLREPDTEVSRRCHGQIRIVTGTFPNEMGRQLNSRFGMAAADMPVYGQTEACYALSIQDRDPRPGTLGVENDSFEVRVVDGDDRDLPTGQTGEIVVRPKKPGVMFQGYWGQPEATLSRMSNMWWHTGDFGRRDADGYFYFVDRAEDRIRRSGENISTWELDEVFLAHPQLTAVATHAVHSELQEDEVKLTAVLKQGEQADPAAVRLWAQGRLPHYALPRFIEFRSELPKNATGKVLKSELRTDGVTAGTWDYRATR